jgi:hypothetical protein
LASGPSGAWPDVPVPAAKGPTARDHLDRIERAAQGAGRDARTAIEAAIDACVHGMCFTSEATPGKPPPADQHGTMILYARVCADEQDWDGCSAAMQHGTASGDRRGA